MQAKHWAVIGGCLAALGTMGSASHEWSEVFSPGFIFGALGVIGTQIGALYMQRPNEVQSAGAKLLEMRSPNKHRHGFRPSGKTER